jgi:vesicular inhibitory amino acid transporter
MFSGEGSRLLQENKIKVDIHGVSGKTSFIEAVFNAINVLLGVGVLSSPFALRSSGVLVGLPLFFFFAVVTNHTAKLLGKCLDYEEGMMVRLPLKF